MLLFSTIHNFLQYLVANSASYMTYEQRRQNVVPFWPYGGEAGISYPDGSPLFGPVVTGTQKILWPDGSVMAFMEPSSGWGSPTRWAGWWTNPRQKSFRAQDFRVKVTSNGHNLPASFDITFFETDYSMAAKERKLVSIWTTLSDFSSPHCALLSVISLDCQMAALMKTAECNLQLLSTIRRIAK